MAYNAQAKLFASDLSNYSEIRRGLSPAMRKATPTLKELKSVDAATQQGLINALNDWRQQGQAQKIQASQLSKGIGSVFSTAAESGYYSAQDKVTVQTALLKAKSMKKDQAEWAIRENLGAVGRLRDQDFYKATYYLDKNEWVSSKAEDGMLDSIIDTKEILKYDNDTIRETLKERHQRKEGSVPSDKEIDKEIANMRATYYSETLDIAKLFTI